MNDEPFHVQLAPCWSKPDADELRARRRRLRAQTLDGPFRKPGKRSRFLRWLAWLVGVN